MNENLIIKVWIEKGYKNLLSHPTILFLKFEKDIALVK